MSKNIRGREGRSPYTTEADRVFLEHMKTAWASLYREGVIPPRYPVPADIGRVSLGQDYMGVWFIDCADQDDPVMLWQYDTWTQKQGLSHV